MIKAILINTTLVVICFCFTTLNAQSVNWKTAEKNNYSLKHPADWEVNLEGQMGTDIILFSPVAGEGDLFRENVNVYIEALPNDEIDLATYIGFTEQNIKGFFTNFNMLESVLLEIDSKPVHKLLYTADQGLYKLTFEQYISLKGDKAYVLTFTSEQNSYEEYKEVGEKILSSFRLGERN